MNYNDQAKSPNIILVIDMQNDFILQDAPLKVAGAHSTIPAIKSFIEYGRNKKWIIIYVCRSHHISGIDAEPFRAHHFINGNGFCITGTKGAEIHSELSPEPQDIIVTKQRFSAFFNTNLDIILKGLKTKNIYITGTQYPNCIRSTAIDAMSRNYNTIVVTDCCSAQTQEIADANITDLKNSGIKCLTSTEITMNNHD